MEQGELLVALALALGTGLLIGFERQQSAEEDRVPSRATMGGVRTFPLVSLFGALATLLSRGLGAWFLALAFAALVVFVAISYADDVRHGREHGATSEVAMLLTFLLGALSTSEGLFAATREKVFVVGATAIVATLVLSLKPPLHALASKATKDDVFATLKFLLLAAVLLPVLPNRAMGPMDAFNPFKLGLMVVLIAGVGFVGYVAVRVLGPGRGMGLTGLLGGLASSTAVTLAASARAKVAPKLAASCALAIVLANAVMSARVLVVVGALDARLFSALAAPVAALVLVGAATSLLFLRRASGEGAADSVELRVANPFSLGSALKMGLLIAAVTFVTKAASVHLGTGGVYAASVLAGTTDVDAISVSMAELAKAGTDVVVPATAILLAIATNTVAKAAIATVVGGWAFGRLVAGAAAATLAAAAAGIGWLWLGGSA